MKFNKMEATEENGRNWFIYAAVISINLISFSTGSAYSWTSPVIPKLNSPQTPLSAPTTTMEESWLAALVSLGAATSPFAAGICSDKFGRKKTLLLFALPMVTAHIILAFTSNIQLFLLARYLLGLGIGCVFSVLPNYVSEIAEDNNRGLMGCIMGLMLATGVLASYIVGPYVNVMVLSFLNLVPIVLFLVIFGVFIPESPYYLVAVNQRSLAQESLEKLRNKPVGAIEKEVESIAKYVEESKANQSGIRDLLRSKSLIKGLVISSGLMVFQQFSGVTAVLSYMQSIFDATGSTIPPDVSAIIIGTVQLFTNFSTSQLVDRLGRRILLLISTLFCGISLASLGIFFFLKTSNYNVDSIWWLPILSLVVYIIGYNSGLGPLPWAIMGELFPAHAKSLASTITTCTCLSLAFLITIFYPSLSLMLGNAQSFWLFSICCGGGFAFTLFVVPETKGKSLQEIQNLFNAPAKK